MIEKNITILGCGRVGATIVYNLIHRKDCKLNINIIDPNSDVEGSILDISHCLSLQTNHKIFFNDLNKFEVADFIFHVAGKRNKIGASRLSVLDDNLAITESIFKNKEFKNDPYVIVVANPVDVIAYHIWKKSTIKPERIIGTGTLLDSMRLQYYISREAKHPQKNVAAWVLGEHGDSMVPIYSQTHIDGVPLEEMMLMDNKSYERIRTCLVQAAATIKKTQGATYYGIASAAVSIFDALIKGDVTSLPASVKINDYYKDLLGVQSDIFFKPSG